MDKQPRKTFYTHQKEQQRVSTAPHTQHTKHTQNTSNNSNKGNNIQLPHLKGRNVTRQSKRPKKQQGKQHEHKQVLQRPQTSKSRRGQTAHKSDSQDDLYQVTKHEKVQVFKKKMQQYPININTITFNLNSNPNTNTNAGTHSNSHSHYSNSYHPHSNH